MTNPTITQGATGDLPNLLTPGEVARMFRVDVKTVTRWADTGVLPVIRTPAGTRRYRTAEVLAALHLSN